MKMKEELFRNLPTEMVIDILSRLPIQSIIMCKIVCKSWHELVDSLEFAYSHLCKAVPHLVVFLSKGSCIPYKMVEFVDEHDSPHRCKNLIANLSLPHPGVILGSANGLLFWCNGHKWSSRDLFVCNPITREIMKLPPPPQLEIFHRFTAGVGVSKMGGQYKIVRILQVYKPYFGLVRCECQLLTLGSGSWRSFSAGTQLEYSSESVGAFLNGNLHWLANNAMRVSCFDLETELFTSFSSPLGLRGSVLKTLSVVGDRLCLCDSIIAHEIVIWFMTEYGDDKSWTKEFIISNFAARVFCESLFPIKVFINGDILIARETGEIFCYSKRSDAIQKLDPLTSRIFVAKGAVIYTPTFLPLRNLLMVTENVTSF